MSCRTTSGGSVSTTLTRAYTGLSDGEVQRIFHALKREGRDVHLPSTVEFDAWEARQRFLIDRAARMSDTRKDGLRAKLFRSRSEPIPDGATFYAWSRIEARARQEVALQSVTTAIDLAPPGSQREEYELDDQGRPVRVWYASYGSNLHRDRFLTYIEGGVPEGSMRRYQGCRDKSLPEADIPIRFAGARPHFALTSRVWHGGIAFIDAQKGEDASCLGRAYAVTREQFEDVVAQENGLRAGQCATIPYEEVLTTSRVVTGRGPYETLLHIGDHDGAPVLTFTAPFSTRDALGRKGQVDRAGVRLPVLTNKPSAAYVRMIGSGLAETFGMDEVAQADYLRGCPGGERWTRSELVQVLRAPAPAPRQTPPSSGARSGGTSGGRIGQSASDGARRPQATLNPTERGLWVRVKTYDSVCEQQEGVAGWQNALRKARANKKAVAESLEWVERQSKSHPNAAQRQHWADRLPSLQEQHDTLSSEVDELTAKVRYAKAQQPATWHSQSTLTNPNAVQGALRGVRIQRQLAQRDLDQFQRSTPAVPEGNSESSKRRARSIREKTRRLENSLAELQRREAELMAAAETLDISA